MDGEPVSAEPGPPLGDRRDQPCRRTVPVPDRRNRLRQRQRVRQPPLPALLRSPEDHVHARASREEERRLLHGAEELGRELVGYYRYDTPAELDLLNQIWALDDAFTNYFLPSLRLASKHRDGAKVVKKYHQAATPHQRALAHPATRKRPIITMNARFKKLRLGALQREILEHTGRLEVLAQAKGRTARQPRAATG